MSMPITLLVIAIALLLVVVAIQLVQLRRRPNFDFSSLERAQERTERTILQCDHQIRSAITDRLDKLNATNDQKLEQMRSDTASSVQKVREEVSLALTSFGGAQRTQLG